MNEQLTLDGEPVIKVRPTLNCYLVGDHDYYAAESARQAEQLHADYTEEDDHGEQAQLVVGELLDKPWYDEDAPGVPAGTLRQWLAEAKGPEWLSGTE